MNKEVHESATNHELKGRSTTKQSKQFLVEHSQTLLQLNTDLQGL